MADNTSFLQNIAAEKERLREEMRRLSEMEKRANMKKCPSCPNMFLPFQQQKKCTPCLRKENTKKCLAPGCQSMINPKYNFCWTHKNLPPPDSNFECTICNLKSIEKRDYCENIHPAGICVGCFYKMDKCPFCRLPKFHDKYIDIPVPEDSSNEEIELEALLRQKAEVDARIAASRSFRH